ncbi:unnamed protein product [Moneuplotes crassus]|uniref:Uncharacterized protein n=1 Tax=Euplotes crassus TaxID=5936 RepID=A0AAD1XRK2_EUPCR|nr:unnamed protein product [Moneuplotes crassus]
MSAKSKQDMKGLRVIKVENPSAPHNFEDFWGFNFMRMLSDGIVTSGANMRVGSPYPVRFENYEFDVKLEDGTHAYLWDGKKEIGIRTRSSTTREVIDRYFSEKEELNQYYNWKLFVSEEEPKDEKAVFLKENEAHHIANYLHSELECQRILVEAGPNTVHKYFKQGLEAKNPFDVLYVAVHFGEVQKDDLVYGKDGAIDFMDPSHQNVGKYNLLNAYDIVHKQDETVDSNPWTYYVLHRKPTSL